LNADEEAGLRAFHLRVDAELGGEVARPVAVYSSDSRIDVATVLATWREEERAGFRVKLADGSVWLLYYVPELDLWSGIAEHRSDHSA
jgi:hypothetical protein